MAENLLRNGGFEADWGEESSHRVLIFPADGEPYETERGEFHTPPGWVSWFYHDPGTWDQPEVGDIRRSLADYRVRSGEKAAKLFTFYRKHDAGFIQRVAVESGQTLRLSAWAHAWSNHGSHDDDPHWSEGAGYDAVRWLESDIPPLNGEPQNDSMGNFAFMLGIDPTGGRDPFAETVVWGAKAYIYNAYYEVPPVEAEAQGDTVTVFLRSKTLWPFKHNDAYWDDVMVEVVEDGSPEPPEPVPTEWHYPVIERGSKIGVHAIYANNVPAFAGQLRDGGAPFPVVKAVDDLGWLEEVKERNPDTIVIGRFTSPIEGCEGVDYPGADHEQMARELVDVILNRARPEHFDLVDYWEICNEPDPPGVSGYRALSQLMIACIDQAEEHGLTLALFALNAGTPEWDEMEAMVESGVFARAREGGHVLALHEGTFGLDQDPQYLWGETIPGSPEVEGAGALNFRYRYLYHLLEQHEQVVPLVISEWYAGNEAATPMTHLVDAAEWYDSEASQDYYHWGFCPFTLGPTPGWEHTDWEFAYPALIDHMILIRDQQNALPPQEPEEPESPDCVPPRVPYRRTYVLLPQIRDLLERVTWRTAVAIGSSETMRTVGHSADDAGVGPPDRQITVINPAQHRQDLKAWFREHYAGVLYREIEASTPWEAAIQLLPDLQEDIAVGQNDARWEGYDFGEQPGEGTTSGYGGLVTGLTMVLRNIYGRRVTPPELDKLLVAARAAFTDNVLVWDEAVALFSAFDGSLKDDNQRSVEELEALWNAGWEIILREVDDPGTQGRRFVYLERIIDGVLHVIDTWDGERKQRVAEDYVASFQGIRAAHLQRMPTAPSFELLATDVEIGDCIPPREPYDRTYLLLPQIQDVVDRLEWRMAAAIASSITSQTFGHSADDAGTGPLSRRITAVNPDWWEGDLEVWYNQHYQGAQYEPVETESPWEMAVGVLPALEGDIALAQNDPRWADYDFGEHPGAEGETIRLYGCFLTGLSIVLRKVYGRDVIPPMLDKLLVAARSAYVHDNILDWQGVVPLFPIFDEEGLKDNRTRSADELRQMLDENWEVILRRADGGHFVYLEDVQGDTLHIIDTWDGNRKQKAAGEFAGVRAAHIEGGVSPPTAGVLLGLHDQAGGEWMVEQGMMGCCLVHYQIQRQPLQLDLRYLQEAGIVVICRLNWGYADGSGTLPRPADRDAFVTAVTQTMRFSQGVDYWHVGNEPNNRQEWPGFDSGDEYALTPQYVVDIYNDIWRRIDGRARMGPPPIDPYFGPNSNNRDWWVYILGQIDGADALYLHSKTQTNDPNEVWSEARFTHPPLQWQYLHLRTVETGLEVVPPRFQDLPVFVTELNPQNLEAGGGVGWVPENDLWVHQAVRYFREEQPVTGVAFYRYEAAGDQAPFGLEQRPVILGAIAEEAERDPALAPTGIRAMPHGLPLQIWRRIGGAVV
jgi:hypothetical protein